ncbi:ATP-dependent dethiobiotin synthetase BioD 1 [Peribacillus sp. Bi96]|uniref:dethiobiotin synthase n=1 Tax=unclassified Peribacillus TaxID=2675266 RepID=UPI001D2EDB14|nr:dethiobiotin synthase [Peribacillus sp. Bi96]CAH0231466.1 ATP-dependent dethiobiotin synthetase BioD 1 [Peribacillus sp. Bi96]
MGQAYFITGTGTDIGKTIVTSALYLSLQALGKSVTIFKPFQTGIIEESKTYPDISWFEQELGVKGSGFYMLEPETSPHLAIKLTGSQIDVKKVVERVHELEEMYDIVLVEGAGGLAVPLIERSDSFYMTKDFIRDCSMPVVFVSTCGLGAIHHVVTTHSYAQIHDIYVKAIVYNHYIPDDRIQNDNIATIEKLTGLTGLACIPTLADVRKDLRSLTLDLLRDQDYTQQLKEVFQA